MGRRFESLRQKFNKKYQEWEEQEATPDTVETAEEWLRNHPAEGESQPDVCELPKSEERPRNLGKRSIIRVNIWDAPTS